MPTKCSRRSYRRRRRWPQAPAQRVSLDARTEVDRTTAARPAVATYFPNQKPRSDTVAPLTRDEFYRREFALVYKDNPSLATGQIAKLTQGLWLLEKARRKKNSDDRMYARRKSASAAAEAAIDDDNESEVGVIQ